MDNEFTRRSLMYRVKIKLNNDPSIGLTRVHASINKKSLSNAIKSSDIE